MKFRTFLAALAVVAFVVSGSLIAADKDKADKAEFKATCPMSSGPAKEANFVMHEGKKVYFCCKNCPKAFEKDPAKVADKVHYQFLQTGQICQVGCPMTGGKVDPATEVALGDVKVGFCCNKCKAKYEKVADDKKLACIFGNLSKGFTLQTACPVSGKGIKADKVAEHDGKKVYFCCDNCPKAFAKDPAKFVDKLPQFSDAD